MPMPLEYAQASRDFDRFMQDAREALHHDTTHQTFQTVQSVLIVFRRRLTVPQALAFADVLPPVLRAIFVKEWDIGEPAQPFADRAAMTREVQHYRRDHDFSPDAAIAAVAGALRRRLPDPLAFDAVLGMLPEGSAQYWSSR